MARDAARLQAAGAPQQRLAALLDALLPRPHLFQSLRRQRLLAHRRATCQETQSAMPLAIVPRNAHRWRRLPCNPRCQTSPTLISSGNSQSNPSTLAHRFPPHPRPTTVLKSTWTPVDPRVTVLGGGCVGGGHRRRVEADGHRRETGEGAGRRRDGGGRGRVVQHRGGRLEQTNRVDRAVQVSNSPAQRDKGADCPLPWDSLWTGSTRRLRRYGVALKSIAFYDSIAGGSNFQVCRSEMAKIH